MAEQLDLFPDLPPAGLRRNAPATSARRPRQAKPVEPSAPSGSPPRRSASTRTREAPARLEPAADTARPARQRAPAKRPARRAGAGGAPTVTPSAAPSRTLANGVALPPYESIALVLQGGGALGAYQAGVYEGLSEAGLLIDQCAGISIGALNLAIIAGNAPEHRVARLREFWDTICEPNLGLFPLPLIEQTLYDTNDAVRSVLSALHATRALLEGQNGFFVPRLPPPPTLLPGDPLKASYYDVGPLKATLERLCDFDRINQGELRVAVGAVNVRNGNFVYFDNRRHRLRAEHFMASGALPPAFGAVEIDGEYYWDGGLVSNTPLSKVLESRPCLDTLTFQVDLWSARGPLPTNMGEVHDRIKDIRYSSRTRLVTDLLRRDQELRHLLQRMLEDIPADVLARSPYGRAAEERASSKRYNIIHLIYRHQSYERHYKDFQFGPSTMRRHWNSGLEDIRNTLQHPDYLALPSQDVGFATHDIHREELDARMGGRG